MKKSEIKIRKMDCPSEIKLIEAKMEKVDQTIKMEFNLTSRIVTFYHDNDCNVILEALSKISLPGVLISSKEISKDEIPEIGPSVEAKTLKLLLAINFTMFLIEIIVGFYAESAGLVADGLDMLADSFVYGISLFAVGKSIAVKNSTAFSSGIMQIALGIICFLEVGRKFYFESEPISSYMIVISIMALFANVCCLVLIHKHKDGEVHMKASWIFSANDVIVNVGVIIAGTLVHFLQTNLPDLIIGAFVSLIVIRGGLAIIRLSKSQDEQSNQKESCCS